MATKTTTTKKPAAVSHAKPAKAKPTKQEQAAAAVARMRQTALDLVKPSAVAEIVQIPVNFIRANAQVRTEFNDETIAELAADIAERGIIQPILVRSSDSGYIIVAGERRYRAAKLAQMDMVPAIITGLDNDSATAVQIAENIQREDLSLADTAKAVRKLYELNGNSVTNTAAKLHKSKSWVSKHLAASCPDLSWQAKQLLEQEWTEDLEIVLTVDKIAEIDYWAADNIAKAVGEGNAGRQSVRDELERVKAEQQQKKVDAEQRNKEFNTPEKIAEREAMRQQHAKEEALRIAAERLDPIRLRCKYDEELDEDQRKSLEKHLRKFHKNGSTTHGDAIIETAAKYMSGDYSVIELSAFIAGVQNIAFDLAQLIELTMNGERAE